MWVFLRTIEIQRHPKVKRTQAPSLGFRRVTHIAIIGDSADGMLDQFYQTSVAYSQFKKMNQVKVCHLAGILLV